MSDASDQLWSPHSLKQTAEQLSVMETEAFFRERAARGDRAAFLRFLDGAGDEPPVDGDRIEAG